MRKKPIQRSWSILKLILPKVPEVETPFFAAFIQWPLTELVKSFMVQKQLPALTWLSHTGQRLPSTNVALAQKLNNEGKLALLLLLPLLQDSFCSCKLSGSHHSCTGATIKGPNVEGRVWLSPKMSDTNALFMQKAYNALRFLSSEQITPLSPSATRFFISDTCLCFFSTSEARWPGYSHEMFARAKFPSNAG